MQAIITENREKIAELCRTHHVRRLSVFGSAAREDFDPERSDVDLLVEFEEARDFRYARNLFQLQRSLAALFGRKVDLLVLGSIVNAPLMRAIEEDRRLLYAA